MIIHFKLIIWKAELSDIQQGEAIISKVENKIIVGTGDGSIILKSVSIDDGLEAEPNSILTDNYIGKKLGIWYETKNYSYYRY